MSVQLALSSVWMRTCCLCVCVWTVCVMAFVSTAWKETSSLRRNRSGLSQRNDSCSTDRTTVLFMGQKHKHVFCCTSTNSTTSLPVVHELSRMDSVFTETSTGIQLGCSFWCEPIRIRNISLLWKWCPGIKMSACQSPSTLIKGSTASWTCWPKYVVIFLKALWYVKSHNYFKKLYI